MEGGRLLSEHHHLGGKREHNRVGMKDIAHFEGKARERTQNACDSGPDTCIPLPLVC